MAHDSRLKIPFFTSAFETLDDRDTFPIEFGIVLRWQSTFFLLFRPGT